MIAILCNHISVINFFVISGWMVALYYIQYFGIQQNICIRLQQGGLAALSNMYSALSLTDPYK